MIQTTCALAKYRTVYLLKPIPEMPKNVPKYLLKRHWLGLDAQVQVLKADYKQRHQRILHSMQKVQFFKWSITKRKQSVLMKNPINYRSLIKQIYRYTRPRSFRHCEKIWPYISIRRDKDGCLCEPKYLGKPISVLSLDEISALKSDDLVIIASGPSVKKIDLNPLIQADWMAVNGSTHILKQYTRVC